MITLKESQLIGINEQLDMKKAEGVAQFIQENYEILLRDNTAEEINTFSQAIVSMAKKYNITHESMLSHLGSLGVFLGVGFDEDPQYEWVKPTLKDPSHITFTELTQHYMAYLQQENGDNFQFKLNALTKLAALDFNDFPKEKAALIPFLRTYFPEKYRANSEGFMKHLNTYNEAIPLYHRLQPFEQNIFVLLQFIYGVKAIEDPLKPALHPLFSEENLKKETNFHRKLVIAVQKQFNLSIDILMDLCDQSQSVEE